MRLLRGVYEGPGSHGILRVAASMRDVHAVVRGLPTEGYFPALYGATERVGDPAPVSLSPLSAKSGDSRATGDLARDLSAAVRRRPGTQAVVLARSEAALLAGEPIPGTSLPDNPSTGRAPELVTHAWERPGLGEVEAADLALEDLVRAHVRKELEKGPRPTVNLFGPPVFGPGAEAEYAEAERLLALIGIEVNARVPLEADVEDLSRLPRAWANVVLYREIGESATLYLQDEFGTQRVTTPMIGAAGTGAALRAVGEICRLDPKEVQRTIWAELARTAKLPWYARLYRPETFSGRVAIFGDFTYSLGLGYALAREVGMEVAACGTYLLHAERDFLFHADTFTEGAFVEDDPEEVAAHIEATNPDLVVGTFFEEEVASSLGIPFLPLCPPVEDRPFASQPLMGYAGCSVLADALDRVLRRSAQRPGTPSEREGLPWTDEALEELAQVPPFLRDRIRRLAEEHARELGYDEVTRETFMASRGV